MKIPTSLLLIFLVVPLYAEETKPPEIPEGYVKQVLEPTGGSILRPRSWYYTEKHGGPRYKWTVSREDPELGPYREGIAIQTLVGIEKGTGQTTQEFCENFLKGRSIAARIVHHWRSDDMGNIKRSEIEVTEGVRIFGEIEEHRVIYSAFWIPEDDLAMVLSAGCPLAEWPENQDQLERVKNSVLIDLAQFKTLGRPEKPTTKPGAPSKVAAQHAISQLLESPENDSSFDHAETLRLYSKFSPDVYVGINIEFLPWHRELRTTEKTKILVAAFVAGNMQPQLQKKVKKDHPLEGLRALLDVYGKLRKAGEIREISAYEEWLRLNEDELKTFVDQVSSRAAILDGRQ